MFLTKWKDRVKQQQWNSFLVENFLNLSLLSQPKIEYLSLVRTSFSFKQQKLLSVEERKTLRMQELFSRSKNEELITKFATEKELNLSRVSSWLKLWKEVRKDSNLRRKKILRLDLVDRELKLVLGRLTRKLTIQLQETPEIFPNRQVTEYV